jgi:acyl carrier protein
MKKLEQFKEDLRQYILQEFLPGEKPSNLKDDTPLRANGIVDSMGILLLVKFVEDKTGIEIESRDLNAEDFSSIESIALFVGGKMRQ